MWSGGIFLLAALGFMAYLVAPFILPGQTGASGQEYPVTGFPTALSATGDDGRERSLEISGPNGELVETDALTEGDRIIVRGSGFDAESGIYVALCQVPDSPDTRPGPCLGGVPELDEQVGAEGAIEWAPSNWINDDWAWRLFGARSFDDPVDGTFTAYILVPAATDEAANCLDNPCGLYTRNDHTALDNRIQDLYFPVEFAQ